MKRLLCNYVNILIIFLKGYSDNVNKTWDDLQCRFLDLNKKKSSWLTINGAKKKAPRKKKTKTIPCLKKTIVRSIFSDPISRMVMTSANRCYSISPTQKVITRFTPIDIRYLKILKNGNQCKMHFTICASSNLSVGWKKKRRWKWTGFAFYFIFLFSHVGG